MTSVSLALMWHQHQPYYPDDVAGENPMPWVRLHGDQGLPRAWPSTSRRSPSSAARSTWSPACWCSSRPTSTARPTGTCRVSRMPGRRPGARRRALPARQLLHGLPRHHDPAASALPRAVPAARPRATTPAEQALRRFRARDLRDLQVWSNLAWIHPLLFEKDPELAEFKAKGRRYTEDEKQWLLDKQRELLRRSSRCTASWPTAARSS